jgi:hypothetical protein
LSGSLARRLLGNRKIDAQDAILEKAYVVIPEQLRDNASKRCKCGFSNLARGAARRDSGLFGACLPQQAREPFLNSLLPFCYRIW